MSFDIKCNNCGAPSSVSVGVCPFCKTTFTNKKNGKKESPLISRIKSNYKDGKIDEVLFACKELYRNKDKIKENNNFLLIYLKALIESDGPSTVIRSLISQILMNDPENIEVMDYLDILDARDELSEEKNDTGEQKLKIIIKRSPKNAYAHFFLGAHLFWVDKEYYQAVVHLENAVKHRPNFVRAWGCLGALYRELGNDTLSKKAFMTASKIETNSEMKKYFKRLVKN